MLNRKITEITQTTENKIINNYMIKWNYSAIILYIIRNKLSTHQLGGYLNKNDALLFDWWNKFDYLIQRSKYDLSDGVFISLVNSKKFMVSYNTLMIKILGKSSTFSDILFFK